MITGKTIDGITLIIPVDGVVRYRPVLAFGSGLCHMSRPPRHVYDKPVAHAPVAQLDRALDYESRGRGFESLPARHLNLSYISIC